MTNAFQTHGDVTVIILSGNREALIDTVDLARVQEYPGRFFAMWDEDSKTFYVVGHKRGFKSTLLHRWIMEPPANLEVDHIHHDGLGNRRGELEVCSHSKNAMNRRGARKGSVSGIRGAHFHTKTGKWRASIWLHGKRKQIGVFPTAEEASTARAAAMAQKEAA
jgi:hypothetical protein